MNTKNNFYRLLILSIVSGILFSCKTKPADESVVRDTKYKQSIIDTYKKVGMFCSLNYVPGLSVAVSIDNKVVFADGFGYSNAELKIKSSPSNLYRVGQISEIITALTTAKLSDEGKLNLDKPVSEMFPDLSKKEAKYSLYQLGVHSSGIREPLTEAGKGKENTYETLIPSFINDPLVFESGQSVLHTDLGYDLLGYLIQKSANEPFYKVVKRTVVDNLHLTGTVADNPYIIFDHKSSQYNYDFVAQPIVAQQVDLRGKEASVGYLSSVLDLVKMGNALLSPGFLKKETLDRLTKPDQLSDGRVSPLAFGLLVNKDMEGHTFLGQKGMVSGGTSTILIYPEDKLVIAMAANIGNSTWELPVFDVASAFQKQLHPEWEAKAKQEQAKQEEAQKKNLQQKETKYY